MLPAKAVAAMLLMGCQAVQAGKPPPSRWVKPGSAGAGYASKKLRVPKWEPKWDMPGSTVAMPCNYSGYYDIASLKGFGYLQFDWSNRKDDWCQAKPMTCSESIANQSAMLHAADPDVKIGVYRNGIKALNWFTEQREKLDDPAYSGWFMPFHAYPNGGWQKNHSYTVSPCTDGKCSGLWHDQTQTPEHHKLGEAELRVEGKPHYDNGVCVDECDCGLQPCGEYIYDHRNKSLAEWFVSPGGPIINNRTILQPGVVSFYIDDSAWSKGFKQGGGTGGITETSGRFENDTGLSFPDMREFVAAYEANMEKLYDNIVEHGGYVWQLFQDGPGLPKSKTDSKGHAVPPTLCESKLRENWCTATTTAAQSAVLYAVHPSEPERLYNDTVFNEQATAEFLLTRGNWSFMGTDWNGCSASEHYYPRMPQWDEDFGVPTELCHETGHATGVFERRWTKATVTWDCNAAAGKITRSL